MSITCIINVNYRDMFKSNQRMAEEAEEVAITLVITIPKTTILMC